MQGILIFFPFCEVEQTQLGSSAATQSLPARRATRAPIRALLRSIYTAALPKRCFIGALPLVPELLILNMSETAPVAPAAAPPAEKVPVKKKTAKKSGGPPRKASGPPVSELITKAVAASKERSGVSLAALKKALAAAGYDVEKNNSRIKLGLKSLVSKGTLVQTKGTGASGSFKLNKKAASGETKPKVKKVGAAKPKKPVGAAKKPRKATGGATPKKSAKKTPKKAKKPAAATVTKKVAKSPKKAKVAKPKKAAKSAAKSVKPKAAKPKVVKPKKAAPKKK